MSSADNEGKSVTMPLDAERERLRKAGYSDAEVSQILVARELETSQRPTGATGQGVMSNVLSSIVAVASHARAVIPSFRSDLATMFDRAAATPARARASASFTVKAIVVLVLGYAAWQEWNQHIISAPEIARQQALKAKAEAAAAAHAPCILEGVGGCVQLEENIKASRQNRP